MLMFLPLAWGKRTARYRLSCSTQRAESISDTRLRTRSETHLASPHVPYSTYNLHYRAVNERRKKNKQLGHPRANAGQCTTVQPGCKLLYLTILTQRYTPTFRIYCALLYSPRPAYIQNHYIANIHRRAAHELSLLFPRRCTGYRNRAIFLHTPYRFALFTTSQARCKIPKEILRIGVVVIAVFGDSHSHRFISDSVKPVVDAFAGLQWADEWNEQYNYSYVQTIQKQRKPLSLHQRADCKENFSRLHLSAVSKTQDDTTLAVPISCVAS